MSERSELLLIGGRSGVGKSTLAGALHWSLSQDGVRHAVIEGDALDLAFPPPSEHHLAEANLTAMWSNYRRLGYRRLIYTNTVSVLHVDDIAGAMGDGPAVTAVLLEASDPAIATRLGARDRGDSLRWHVRRSAEAAAQLAQEAPSSVLRLDADRAAPEELAANLRSHLGW